MKKLISVPKMNINEKILKLLEELSEALEFLNNLYRISKDEEKEEIRELIEFHIGYVVFLKELELELKANAEKKFTKEFLVKQFSAIHKSCQMIKDLNK